MSAWYLVRRDAAVDGSRCDYKRKGTARYLLVSGTLSMKSRNVELKQTNEQRKQLNSKTRKHANTQTRERAMRTIDRSIVHICGVRD
jgi:hypothetical protein